MFVVLLLLLTRVLFLLLENNCVVLPWFICLQILMNVLLEIHVEMELAGTWWVVLNVPVLMGLSLDQ